MSFVSRYFLISSLISSVISWVFSNVLFSLHVFVFFMFFPCNLFLFFLRAPYLLIYLFIYFFWLCWIFVSMRGLSLVVASGGRSSSRCAGFSLLCPLLLQGTGSRCAGSVVVAHGPSCSMACGIFADQGSNPCPLHWLADSQPLSHHGSPVIYF